LVEKYFQELKTRGVTVIPDLFTPEQTAIYHHESVKVYDELQKATVDWEDMEYTTMTDRVRTFKRSVKYLNSRWEKFNSETDPLEDKVTFQQIAPGRYDFTFPKTSVVFKQEEYMNPPVLKELILRLLGENSKRYEGAVPAKENSGNGNWHRDIFPLHPEKLQPDGSYDDSEEMKLDPLYLSVLIPTQDLTPANGSTEFIFGSHNLPAVRAIKKGTPLVEAGQFFPKAGSAIVFDGRILHRGRANTTDQLRMVVHHTYHSRWYNAHAPVDAEVDRYGNVIPAKGATATAGVAVAVASSTP